MLIIDNLWKLSKVSSCLVCEPINRWIMSYLSWSTWYFLTIVFGNCLKAVILEDLIKNGVSFTSFTVASTSNYIDVKEEVIWFIFIINKGKDVLTEKETSKRLTIIILNLYGFCFKCKNLSQKLEKYYIK